MINREFTTGLCDFELIKTGNKLSIGHVFGDGTVEKLTLLQTKILTILLNNFNETLTPDTICYAVWGWDCNADYRALRVHISKIRMLLEKVDSNYMIISEYMGIKLSYFKPLEKIVDTKNALLLLLKTKDPEEITDNDLELIRLLSE